MHNTCFAPAHILQSESHAHIACHGRIRTCFAGIASAYACASKTLSELPTVQTAPRAYLSLLAVSGRTSVQSMQHSTCLCLVEWWPMRVGKTANSTCNQPKASCSKKDEACLQKHTPGAALHFRQQLLRHNKTAVRQQCTVLFHVVPAMTAANCQQK